MEELSPDEIRFEHKSTHPQEDLCIGQLSNVLPEQLLTLKAKVVNLQKAAQISTHAGVVLTKREAVLLDPTGTITLVLWEHDVDTSENGITYTIW